MVPSATGGVGPFLIVETNTFPSNTELFSPLKSSVDFGTEEYELQRNDYTPHNNFFFIILYIKNPYLDLEKILSSG